MRMSLQIVLYQVAILLSVEFHTASCDTFYIVPTPDSHCPGEFIGVPCLTLQQYASNPSQSQNITFLVEPATYNLSRVLTVSNGYNFTMSSTNATVVCTSSTARFTFDTVENVHIRGMTFRGCTNTAVRILTVTRAEIISSNFIDNQCYCDGGGIYVSSSSITITDSEFLNNEVYYYSGGSIYATSSTLEIIRSSFSQNRVLYYYPYHAGYGGAIYATSSNLIIDMSSFSYFSVYYSGGAIYYHTYNSYSSVQGGFFHLNNTAFVGNKATRSSGGSGGAVYVRTDLYSSTFYRNSSVVVTHCQFLNSTATGNGGALFISATTRDIYQTGSSTMVLMFQNDYRNNIANNHGGAIYITGTNKSVSVTGSSVINNTANNFGGCLYVDGENNSISVTGSSVINNTANNFGGCLYVDGENNSISVTGSSFVNNTALREGGGAIYSNGRYTNVTLSSSTFTNNSASYCGVLDVDDYNHFSVNLTNSVFTYNTATGQTIGGGVACIRNASINIINSVFKHNFANYHAGVFYIDESVTTVDGSLFVNNSAAVDGGVFYTYVHASDYIIRRSQFSENTAGDDGGVMLIGRLNSFVSIDESIFDFNNAVDRGGVIALIASSIFMEINRTNIFNNTAEYGGVMSACNSQVTLFDDYLFVTVDPLLSFCTLYEGDIRHFNITAPQEPEIAMTTAPPTTAPPTITEPPTTTAPPTTTEPPTTTAPPTTTEPPTTTTPPTTTEPPTTTAPPTTTEPPTTTAPPTTNELPTTTAPPTTNELPTTTAPTTTTPPTTTEPPTTTAPNVKKPPTTKDDETNEQPTTTQSLDEIVNQYSTRDQSTTTDSTPGDVNVVLNIEALETKLTIMMGISLALSIAAILMSSLLLGLHFKKQSTKSKPALVAKKETNEFNPSFLHVYTSPIFNPLNVEEKEQL